MITFGIPLRSRAASSEWSTVSMLFNRTLKSVYNQTDPDFRIIVACHQIPDINFSIDDRVEFICLTTPPPINKNEMMIDKGDKVHAIAKRVRQLHAGFVMMVDADDLVSNRIASYVNSNPNSNGYVSTKGYYYHLGDGFFKKGIRFPNGSSTIVKYSLNDLPSEDYICRVDGNNSNPHLIRKRHGDIPNICKQEGRPLQQLPFIASIYVRRTGENHSLIATNESLFRRIEQVFEPKIIVTKELKKEFSIDWI